MTFDLSQFAGKITENLQENAQFPALRVLQKNGAETDETHKDYELKSIPDARPGQLAYIPEKKILGKSAVLIPLALIDVAQEWKPKTDGGGLVATHHPVTIKSHPEYRREGNDEFLGTNNLVMTRLLIAKTLIDEEWVTTVTEFKRSLHKSGRELQQRLIGYKHPQAPTLDEPPMFCAKWQVDVDVDNNKKGSWYTYKWSVHEPIDLKESKFLEELSRESEQLKKLFTPSTPVDNLPSSKRTAERLAAPTIDADIDDEEPF